MNIFRFLIPVLLFTLLYLPAPAIAQMGGGMGGGMMGGMGGGMMAGRMDMMQENMRLLKELMTIVRDLNHSPTMAQKKKLDEMIGRIDELLKSHEQMMK